jgi:putative transposase
LTAWLARWAGKYPRRTARVEENLEETLSCYRFPRQHHKHLKSTNHGGITRTQKLIMRQAA